MAKEFSKEDYKRCDSNAKHEGMKLCLDSGRYMMEERSKEFDFIMQRIMDDGSVCDVRFEVAIKEVWPCGIWPTNWKTVHMKESRRISKADYFILFNKGLDTVWIIPMADAKKAPIVTVPNKKIAEGEKFFDIPVEWGKFWKKSVGSEKWGPLNTP